MEDTNPTHWRQMFDAKRRDRPPEAEHLFGQPEAAPRGATLGGYDDGFDPSQRQASGNLPHPSLTPEEITDEAAMALAFDEAEYKPWVLQRGRSRPAMMLHLRRYEPKSGLWVGWQLAYPHLVAVEYTGDRLLSLDFGTRHFIVEGSGLHELARHLQIGSVLMVQEFAKGVWSELAGTSRIDGIRLVS
jgi:hypothetical protein